MCEVAATFTVYILEAFDDVTTAINLCSDKHRKTLCQAHCQRGLLHRRTDRIDQARYDFEIAAKMGNQFAKGQVIMENFGKRII